MHSVSVNLDPGQYLSGYRAEAAAIFLPALSHSRVGDEVAVRIGIYGQTIRATLFGKVSLVRRVGRPTLPPGIELHLDKHSIAAATFLAMAARGEPVTFREREPRWSVDQKLTVEHAGKALQVATLNVSESGCAVRWPGPLPLVGDVVAIRIGEGLFAAKAQTIVCWNQPGGALERSVGLKMVSRGRGARAWRGLVAKVAKSGARAA